MAADLLTEPTVDRARAGERAPGPLRLSRVDGAAWAPALAVTLIVGLSLLVGMVGADARWLAALGGDIAAHARIPPGVPFAAAPSAHWHNVTVGGALGAGGLAGAGAPAVAFALAPLPRAPRRSGARSQQTASACLLAALGG